VTGQFSALTSNLAFLTPSLAYDSQNVTLTMTRNGAGFGPDNGGGSTGGISIAATRNQGFIAVGLRAEAQIGAMPLFARAMLGWRHGFGELTPQARTAFLAGTTPATVFAARIDREALVAEAGLYWRISSGTALGLTYSADMGSTRYGSIPTITGGNRLGPARGGSQIATCGRAFMPSRCSRILMSWLWLPKPRPKMLTPPGRPSFSSMPMRTLIEWWRSRSRSVVATSLSRRSPR
jgi:hypothetical protein